MEERREYERYKAIEGIPTTIRAGDSTMQTEGIVLNISKAGAYVLADSIPFESGEVTFEPAGGPPIRRQCRRVYPHRSGARGQAVAFGEALGDDELEALKAPIVE